MKKSLRSTITLALLLMLAIANEAVASDIIVSAAASLTNVFQEVAATYEKRNPADKVVLNFGASGALLPQIANGAPADILATADQETMDKASKAGLLAEGSRKNFTANALVLVAPLGTAAQLKGISDLASPEFRRIGIGDPGFVPAGRYAMQSIEAAGRDASIRPKVIMGANVRQVLDYLVRGEVDAGFVFATDAQLQKDKLGPVVRVAGHKPILYPVAVIAASGNKEAAARFLDFLGSPEAKAAMARYGFLEP